MFFCGSCFGTFCAADFLWLLSGCLRLGAEMACPTTLHETPRESAHLPPNVEPARARYFMTTVSPGSSRRQVSPKSQLPAPLKTRRLSSSGRCFCAPNAFTFVVAFLPLNILNLGLCQARLSVVVASGFDMSLHSFSVNGNCPGSSALNGRADDDVKVAYFLQVPAEDFRMRSGY